MIRKLTHTHKNEKDIKERKITRKYCKENWNIQMQNAKP